MARHFAWALLAMFVAVPASAAAPQQGADVTQSESHGRQEEKNRESRSQDQNRVKWWIDPERRRIPDHWHAHARPGGGFFDPASDLYGRYG